MKKILIFLSIILLFPQIVMAEEPNPPDEDYSKYPGYVDFQVLEGLKKGDKSVEVYLKKPLLALVAALSAKEDPSLQQLLSNLVLIRVENFNIEEDETKKVEDVINNISNKLSGNKWEKVIRAIEKGEHVEIFIKPEETKISGLLVMAMDNNKEVTFINIVGEIDFALLGKLGAKFNIPIIDTIKPEAEKKQ